MGPVQRIPERLRGLATDEDLITVVPTYKALFFPGDARMVLACGDSWVYVDSHEIETVATDDCFVGTKGPLRAYDRAQFVAMFGCEAHAHMQCKFVARPGSTVYMYESASGCALNGSTVVIDRSARNEPELCGHRIRVIDQRRAANRPVFVI